MMKAFISEWETPTWPPSIQMGVTAGIFLASYTGIFFIYWNILGLIYSYFS
jgi:hypothetical protein